MGSEMCIRDRFNRKYVSDKAVLINTDELRELTGLGRDAAIKLGLQAGARVVMGRLIFWHKKKILDEIERLAGN